MLKRIVSGMKLTLLLTSMLTLAFNIQPVNGSETIYIRADGSIEGTDKIQRYGNVYTFADNIHDSIVVGRSNVIVNGNGYTLEGPGTGIGITLGGNNITIKNMTINGFVLPGAGFEAAIYSFETSNCIITGNTIVNNKWGINLEWVDGYIISHNILANHNQAAIYGEPEKSRNIVISYNLIKNNKRAITLGGSSNEIHHNDFIDNASPGFWGEEGVRHHNYWSDYTGVDANGDGIGDTIYSKHGISDNYPLMKPTSGLQILGEEVPLWMQWWFWAIVAAGIVVLAGAVYFLKKRKPSSPITPTSPTRDT